MKSTENGIGPQKLRYQDASDQSRSRELSISRNDDEMECFNELILKHSMAYDGVYQKDNGAEVL